MKNRHILIPATSAAVALTVGVLAGGGTGFATGRATAPTPDACIVAIDEGERALGLTADGLGLAGEAVVAAASWDAAELNRITGELDDITAELGDGATYRDAATECRDGAR